MGIVLLLGVLLSALVSGWLSTASAAASRSLSGPRSTCPSAWPSRCLPTTSGVLAYAFLLGLGFGAYISIDLAL